MNFYERYEYLCKKHGLTPCSDKMAETLGVTKATISNWKRRGSLPNGAAVISIANTFHVSADYILCRTDKEDGSFAFNTAYSSLDETDRAKIDGFIQGLLTSDKYKKKNQQLA